MEPITALLSQMSIESIILFVVGILVAAKALSEVVDWAYMRLKKYFNVKTKRDENQEEIIERLDRIEKRSIERDKKVDSINTEIGLIKTRLQDSTRSYIIDKYHYYVQELGVIDEAALQDIERRYLYYKEGGGDSFIELRMEELRQLPVITPEQLSIAQKRTLNNVRSILGGEDDDGR